MIDEKYLDTSLKAAAIASPIHQYGIPVISGRHQVALIGDNVGYDLVFLAFYLKKDVCDAINKKMGISTPIVRDYTCCGIDVAKQFNGAYGGNDPIGANDDVTNLAKRTKYAGFRAGCADESGTGTYYYYHVLLSR